MNKANNQECGSLTYTKKEEANKNAHKPKRTQANHKQEDKQANKYMTNK